VRNATISIRHSVWGVVEKEDLPDSDAQNGAQKHWKAEAGEERHVTTATADVADHGFAVGIAAG
jgi:hypothetical protein